MGGFILSLCCGLPKLSNVELVHTGNIQGAALLLELKPLDHLYRPLVRLSMKASVMLEEELILEDSQSIIIIKLESFDLG